MSQEPNGKRVSQQTSGNRKKIKTFAQRLEEETHTPPLLDEGIIGDQVWERPPLPENWALSDITFQQIEAQESSNNTIELFGVTTEGNSVMCRILNFLHYFYVLTPQGYDHERDHTELANALKYRNDEVDYFPTIEVVDKQSIWGYTGDARRSFLRITVHHHYQISSVRSNFTRDVRPPFITNLGFEAQTYDNISYLLRCTIDCKIVGMSWITLPAGKYTVSGVNGTNGTANGTASRKLSRCQIEASIDYKDLIAHESDGEWLKSAPLRIMSFDIECAGRPGCFPEAGIDPVIQIANVVQIQGSQRPFIRNVFTLNTCSQIIGSQVLEHKTEQEMLMAWSKFVNAADPDVIIGYNTTNFDFPYLLDRAGALNLTSFPFFGRLTSQSQVLTESKFSSKAYGNSVSRTTKIHGRIQIDMLQYIRREFKLRSYTLNNVSSRFLDEQKEDVHHSVISDLQNGNADTRYRLAVYCLKDAYLPLRLLDKLMTFVNMTEMARVTGVPLSFLLSRGQQIKVISQLFRKCLDHDMVVPDKRVTGSPDEQFEGATVIEPIRGHYKQPIATLDFSSLYPSIMMAHNLCYSTLIENDAVIKELGLKEGEDYVVTPIKQKFIKSNKRQGLLPIILQELITARKKAKNDLKNESDPFKRAVLDGRQLALKVSANSVYGFTGATVGKLPCLEISSSVTGYGREMIEATKSFVEQNYNKEHGYEFDSKVIYGDTDSVMVKFGTDSLEESMRLGEEAASRVSEIFQNPIQLEFEKVYYPYLLINKKRYAGLLWTNPKKFDKMDTKGIETVRRDNCKLVQYVVETVLQKILINRDEEAAQSFVKQTIKDLMDNRVDMSLLVISKQLAKTDYASKQPHSELAKRMEGRDKGSAPALGDRIPYVIIQGNSYDKNYDKSEDPIYAIEHNLRVDTEYYLENQLKKPLTRIFEPILDKTRTERLLSTANITVRKITTGSSPFMKSMTRAQACKGCRIPLRGGFKDSVVCKDCLDKVPELYAKELSNVNELQVRFSKLWTECQSCQESTQHDVVCAALDCPIFFMRRRVQIDLAQSRKELKKFEYTW